MGFLNFLYSPNQSSDVLQSRFYELTRQFSADENLQKRLWSEIESHYNDRSRHYHNLEHIANMIAELDGVKKQIGDFDVILFSVFYHDIVYDATSGDNEEKSAELAAERLKSLGIDDLVIDKVSQQIIATKTHEKGDDDTNFLLDADLSILGKDPQSYHRYAAQIRKEYQFYPDLLYNPGRKKILQHFLDLPEIYKTNEFREKYEQQARLNLKTEIVQLQ